MQMVEDVQEQLIGEIEGKGKMSMQGNPVKFSMEVEKVAMDSSIPLLEALQHMVEKNHLDPEDVPKLVTLGLKQKLAIENNIDEPRAALEL